MLLWIPFRRGIWGNEEMDALAREGSGSTNFSLEPGIPITSRARRLRTVMAGENAVLPD